MKHSREVSGSVVDPNQFTQESLQRSGPPLRVVTLRAVSIGLSLSILSCIWISYSSYIVKSASLPVAHFPVAALLPFIAVLTATWLIKYLSHKTLLNPAELLLVFFMVLTGSAIPGWAFTTYWVALVGTPLYFATPQNRWEAVFFDYLPDWLVASNQGGSMQWFFEGLPPGFLIPWSAWLPPFVWWSSFFLALFVVGACLMIILRKQWVEYEKLTFPLAQVPVLLTRESETGDILPDVVRNKMFVAGFSLVMFILLWNAISYFGWLSPIQIGQPYSMPVTIAKGFPPIHIRLNWLVFGFAYFANVDVLFSIWIFRIIAILQEGTLAQFGFNLSDPNLGISSITAAQHIGGFFFFVLWGFWMARRHLYAVVKKAFGNRKDIDDSQELLSYRIALIGILVGSFYIICWLNKAGMSVWVAILLLTCVLLLYLGITRIVAETGVVLLDMPLNAHDFTVSIVGSSNMDPATLTAMGMANAFARNWRTLGMNAMAHVAKVGEEILGEKRKIFAVVILSLSVSIIASVGSTIYMGYSTTGAGNFGDWGFNAGNQIFYDNIVKWISTPTALGLIDLGFLGFGAIIMWGLIQLRYQFAGWPLHPVGFAIASAYATDMAMFSVFMAWFIKSIMFRIGGVSLYKKTQPFFIGILFAFSIGVGISFLVDVIWFPRQGHLIDSW